MDDGKILMIGSGGQDMPEKVPNKELDEQAVRPAALPATPSVPKPRAVELEFDEGDAPFRKRTDE